MKDILKWTAGVVAMVLWFATLGCMVYLAASQRDVTEMMNDRISAIEMKGSVNTTPDMENLKTDESALKQDINQIDDNIKTLDQNIATLAYVIQLQQNISQSQGQQNITVVVVQQEYRGRPTSSPMYPISNRDMQINCIDCFMPQILCFHIDGKLHCSIPLGVNVTTPEDDNALTEDGVIVCDEVNPENCYNMTLTDDWHPL